MSQKYIKKTQKYQPCGLYTDFFKDKKMYIPDIKLDFQIVSSGCFNFKFQSFVP